VSLQLILISLRTTLFHMPFPHSAIPPFLPFRIQPFRPPFLPFNHSHHLTIPSAIPAVLPLCHSTIPSAQVKLPMIRIHTCEFTHTDSYVIDQSHDFVLTTWYSSYLSHPLRFLAYLLNLYVDTWSCLHVCPSLAYYGESYFAQ
jgi:hypothetical protein